jgi:hypothetical protein
MGLVILKRVYTGGNISNSSSNKVKKPITINKLTAENLKFLKQVGLKPKRRLSIQ